MSKTQLENMFKYYFYLINNFDVLHKKFLGVQPFISIEDDKYKILTDLSNIRIDYAQSVIEKLTNISSEYIWGTEMLEIRSVEGASTVFYSQNEVCDTEFTEKIPNVFFVELLNNWIIFLRLAEIKKNIKLYH